jgi:hypothetical protein
MECAQLMKIKLTRNYSTYRINDVIDCEDETAKRLIADGLAVREQQLDLIETASVDPGGESADATPRRRGRPPKGE